MSVLDFIRYGRLIFKSAGRVAAPVNGQKGWISHLHSGHALDKSPRNVTCRAAAATVAIAVASGAHTIAI